MEAPFKSPLRSMRDDPFHYCPGCGHGLVHRLIGEVLDELPAGPVICVFGIGCYLNDLYFNVDCFGALHGRAPAAATGIKRARPEALVFTYQGDGGLSSIGLGEFVHAANRGENITTIMVNNLVYGMTGGQSSPTTLLGQRTATSPHGRTPESGHPLKLAELIASLPGVGYAERTAVISPKHVRQTRNAIRKGFKQQRDRKGYSYVEVLSPCPTNLHMEPVENLDWIAEEVIRVFPLGKLVER